MARPASLAYFFVAAAILSVTFAQEHVATHPFSKALASPVVSPDVSPPSTGTGTSTSSRTSSTAPLPTKTPTPTKSVTATPTTSPTAPASPTPTKTVSATATPTKTVSGTATPTKTSSTTGTITKTVSSSPSPTRSLTASVGSPPSATATNSPPSSLSRSPSSSAKAASATATGTSSATNTIAQSASPSPTQPPTPPSSQSPSCTATPSPSFTTGLTLTITPTISGTISDSSSVSPPPSESPSYSPTASPSSSFNSSPSPSVTRSFTRSIAPTAATSAVTTRSASTAPSPRTSTSRTTSPTPKPVAPLAFAFSQQLTPDLALRWHITSDRQYAWFEATLNVTQALWFGISTLNATRVVIAHGQSGSVAGDQPEGNGGVLFGVYSVSDVAVEAVLDEDRSKAVLGSTLTAVYTQAQADNTTVTVMTWCQPLGSSATDMGLARSDSVVVQYFIGAATQLPPPQSSSGTPIQFTSLSALLAPTIPPLRCEDVQLAQGLNMTWTVVNGELLEAEVKLFGKQAWVSVGWSDTSSGKMVGGDVVVGRWDVPVESAVQEYVVTGRKLSGIRAFTEQALTGSSISYSAGNTVLSFTRDFDTGQKGKFVIPKHSAVTVLWAYGSDSSWQQHTEAGSIRVNYFTCAVTATGIRSEYIVHGVLMGITWGLLIPLGLLIARFGRGVKRPTVPVAGTQPWWFIRHKYLQYSGCFLLCVAFCVALYMKDGVGHFASAHSRLGLTVVVGTLLQPLNALVRPPPKGEHRGLWTLAHKGLGYSMLLLSVPTMYLGMCGLKAPQAVAFATAYAVVFSVGLAVLAALALWNLRRAHWKYTGSRDGMSPMAVKGAAAMAKARNKTAQAHSSGAGELEGLTSPCSESGASAGPGAASDAVSDSANEDQSPQAEKVPLEV